jgi:hypothetical protein
LLQQPVGVHGKKGRFYSDSAAGLADLPKVFGRASSRIERTPGLGMERWRPKRMIVVFAAFHAVCDVGSVLGPPLLIDDNRQIAAMPDRIHGGEENEPIAAKQILCVVFGSDQQHVDAGLLHQQVEPAHLERYRGFAISRGDRIHVRPPAPGS